jgi:DNA-binding CsgD family transcriptional regulator
VDGPDGRGRGSLADAPPDSRPPVGRATELRTVEELLTRVRAGQGAALVLVGEPGIGKTTLVRHAARAAEDMQTLDVVGAESERQMAYAALHRLLLPHLDRLDRLPPPQRAALTAAFGQTDGPAPDRFRIGLGALTLLADVAGDRPLLCTVDDAHWLDPETLEALAFVARRLQADRIGVLLALREGDPAASTAVRGLPTLRVGGLSSSSSRELLSRAVPGRLDDAVATQVAAETGGNPLALLTLVEQLTAEQLAGRAALPVPLPAAAQVRRWFLSRVRALPAPTQLLLLVASLAQPEDPPSLWRAAAELGLGPLDADPAIAEGIVTIGREITFRHPLLRSAVHAGATVADRRRAHAALAAAIPAGSDPERRAWHLAAATPGTDDEAAEDLELAGERVRNRGGYATWAAFLERSADLTADPEHRARRFVAAARAHLYAGSPDLAQAALDRAAPGVAGVVVRARAEQVRAAISSYHYRHAEVPARLLRALAAAGPADPQLTRDLLWEAMRTAVMARDALRGTTLPEVARTALSALADLGPGPADSDRLLRAFAVRIAVGAEPAVPLFREAVTGLAAGGPVRTDAGGRVLLAVLAADELWDDDGGRVLLDRVMRFDREHGDLNELALALRCSVAGLVRAGRFDDALASQQEAAELTRTMGMPPTGDADLVELWAWQGREAEARTAGDLLVDRWAGQAGMGVMATVARQALGILELGLGRYEQALDLARRVYDEDAAGFANLGLADLVEAGVRAGDLVAAEAGLARLAARAGASGTPWALGLLARSRALLAGDDAEPLFQEALAQLGRTEVRPELARTRLTYGEWLRRRNRRIDARDQLRGAHESFARMGAAAFAERARTELLATGARVQRPTAHPALGLTPQESQVAALAADGATNAEIASRLFVTVSTVEYHMNKVLRKLDVTSRRQLGAALHGSPAAARPAGSRA